MLPTCDELGTSLYSRLKDCRARGYRATYCPSCHLHALLTFPHARWQRCLPPPPPTQPTLRSPARSGGAGSGRINAPALRRTTADLGGPQRARVNCCSMCFRCEHVGPGWVQPGARVRHVTACTRRCGFLGRPLAGGRGGMAQRQTWWERKKQPARERSSQPEGDFGQP